MRVVNVPGAAETAPIVNPFTDVVVLEAAIDVDPSVIGNPLVDPLATHE
jgi:hypothetical protein